MLALAGTVAGAGAVAIDAAIAEHGAVVAGAGDGHGGNPGTAVP